MPLQFILISSHLGCRHEAQVHQASPIELLEAGWWELCHLLEQRRGEGGSSPAMERLHQGAVEGGGLLGAMGVVDLK